MRDYTSEDEPPLPSPSKGPMGFITDYSRPVRRTSPDSQLHTIKNGEIATNKIREHITSSPSGRDSSARMRESEPSLATLHNGGEDNQEQLRKLDFDLEAIDEGTSYEPSISTASHLTQNTGMTSNSSGRLPDFFAPEVFQTVLHNPTTSHQLLRFSQSRLCGENMEFLEKVDKYNTLLTEVAKYMFEIHRDYISVNAINQVNLPENLLIKVNKDLKAALAITLPKLESVFVDSQNDIERLVAMDIYPRFVRHQMTMSAARALATDREKYAGLGDCFVLTDPAKADNPIMYASDGFVKVTGYARNEIIPRNCRFLQTRHTDTSAVRRLKEAIDTRHESVELLLNQKKNGEPFWNLLYTTPLFDAAGNCVFFLGGQINCSTTVHNASDVLKILSQTHDTDEKAAENVIATEVAKNPSRASRFLSTFRSKSYQEPQKAPGMEEQLVSKIEKLNLRKQMDTFYSAYSKVSSALPITSIMSKPFGSS
jgi:PAS domain S-box-containing protein